MPVVGHAFVGVATALATARPGGDPRSFARRALWVPVLVLLAYLPDLPGSILAGRGFTDARALGHSVLFAAVLTGPLGFALARWAGLRPRLGMAIVAASLLIHDGLDMLQSTDRNPLWPFTRERWSLDRPLLPRGAAAELILFGGAFALFLAALARRKGTAAWSSLATRSGLVGVAGAGLVMIVALGVHFARGARERAYRGAEASLREGRYVEALALLDRADAWPSVTTAGRIDYLRAEAYQGLGETALAESHYLRSFRASPGYFWLLADLAAFYAGSDRPLAERHRLVDPLVARLRADFADEAELPAVLARIDRRLAPERPGGDATRRSDHEPERTVGN